MEGGNIYPVAHFEMPYDAMEISGAGLSVSFIDTEGDRAGMLQPVPCK